MVNSLNSRPNVTKLFYPPPRDRYRQTSPRARLLLVILGTFSRYVNMRAVHEFISHRLVKWYTACSWLQWVIIVSQALRLSIKLTQPHFKATRVIMNSMCEACSHIRCLIRMHCLSWMTCLLNMPRWSSTVDGDDKTTRGGSRSCR